MATTPSNTITPTRPKLGNVISIILGGESPKVDATTDPKTLTESWQFFGNNKDFTPNVETEDDPETFFDPLTKKYCERKNTTVKTFNLKFTLTQCSQIVYELQYYPNGKIVNGKPTKIFANNEVSKPCWLKIEKYDRKGDLLGTITVWGHLRLDGDITETNKSADPKFTLEVESSEFNDLTAVKDMGYTAEA